MFAEAVMLLDRPFKRQSVRHKWQTVSGGEYENASCLDVSRVGGCS